MMRDYARLAKLVDASDLKSDDLWLCGFDSRTSHHSDLPSLPNLRELLPPQLADFLYATHFAW